jgi:FdhD protein
VRLRLAGEREERLTGRRRALAGPVGCGLCGIESLEAAARAPRRVAAGGTIDADAVMAAMKRLAPLQALNHATRAIHAAAFCPFDGGDLVVREDVGRHNALDKLAGALARAGLDASAGMVLLTSRLSVEMVQKSAAIGAAIIVAVSAPTALAIRTAEAAGQTLIGIARGDGFEVFAGAERVTFQPARAVAGG